jgi:hypothetical protein
MRLCFAEMAKRYAGERVLETGLPGQVCRRKSAGNRGMPERECWKPGYAGERVLETGVCRRESAGNRGMPERECWKQLGPQYVCMHMCMGVKQGKASDRWANCSGAVDLKAQWRRAGREEIIKKKCTHLKCSYIL